MRSQSVWLVDKISVKMLKTSKKGSNLQKSLWSVGAAKISGYAGDIQNFFLVANKRDMLIRMSLLCEQWNVQSVQKSSKVADIFKIDFPY